jgi:hypothetical protein
MSLKKLGLERHASVSFNSNIIIIIIIMTLPIIIPITPLWLQKDCGFSCDLHSLGYVSIVVWSIILAYTQAVQNIQFTVEDKVWWGYRNNGRDPVSYFMYICCICVFCAGFIIGLCGVKIACK